MTPGPTAPGSPVLGSGLHVAWSPSPTGFVPHTAAYGLSRLSSGEYLLLGRDLEIGGASSMAASSSDGSHWTLIGAGLSPVPDVTLLAAASMTSVGAVAVGSQVSRGPDQGGGLTGTVTGVVYLRRSGAGWTRVADQPPLQGADMRGVVATADRFVAFGGYADGIVGLGCSWGCLYGAGIWTSPDGQTWTAALREPSTPTTYELLGGVVVGPAGLLAYARRGDVDATIIWTSPDGGAWTEVQPTGLDGIGLNGVVATAAGYLGVAAVRVPGPTIFRSPDGVHWTPAAPSGPSLGGIIVVDDGFVAWNNLASDTSAFVTASYGVWTSPDGVTWLHTDAYEEFYSGAMVADGRTLISIGSNNDPNPVWIGTITVVPPGQ